MHLIFYFQKLYIMFFLNYPILENCPMELIKNSQKQSPKISFQNGITRVHWKLSNQSSKMGQKFNN